MSSNLLPCPTCPWRVDQRASSIPRFKLHKACGNTVGKGDAFRKIMACHYSTENVPTVCKGYLAHMAQKGVPNINVRLAVAKGEMPPPDRVLDACEAAGVIMHPNYSAVLKKLKATQKEETDGRLRSF